MSMGSVASHSVQCCVFLNISHIGVVTSCQAALVEKYGSRDCLDVELARFSHSLELWVKNESQQYSKSPSSGPERLQIKGVLTKGQKEICS
eukprot:214637-Amphidinium_carterae.1